MAADQYVLKFKKDATPESKKKELDKIKANGGKILKDDNVDNPIFSYALVEVDPEHKNALNDTCLKGDSCLERVEENSNMSI